MTKAKKKDGMKMKKINHADKPSCIKNPRAGTASISNLGTISSSDGLSYCHSRSPGINPSPTDSCLLGAFGYMRRSKPISIRELIDEYDEGLQW